MHPHGGPRHARRGHHHLDTILNTATVDTPFFPTPDLLTFIPPFIPGLPFQDTPTETVLTTTEPSLPTTTTSVTPPAIHTPIIPPANHTQTTPSLPIVTPVVSPSTSSPKLTPTPSTKVVIHTATTHTSTSTIAPLPSTSSASNNSKSNSGAIGGGVFGALIGVGLFAALIFWVVGYFRSKAEMRNAFNASSFRRSAFQINDPVPPPTGLTVPPPMVQPPTVPPASFPYAEQAQYVRDPYGQYAAGSQLYNVSAQGADGQITREPYPDAYYGGNVTGATYGQHASYGSPYQQAQRFSRPPSQSSDPLSQQFPLPPPSPATSLRSHGYLPNPFADVPPAATAGSGSLTPTQATFANVPDSSPPPSPPRKDGPVSVPPVYEPAVRYTEMQRDVKPPSTGAGPSVASPQVQVNAQRPVSMHTVYDDGDAYGGI